MTQLTLFGPEAAPFIFPLAHHLAHLDHCVMVLQIGPDHSHVPVEAVHLMGIRLGELQVRPENFAQAVQAVSSAGFGHALVVWSGPNLLPTDLALTRANIKTERIDLQELMAKLTQRIEQSRLSGTGPLTLTVTDIPPIH